MAMSRAGSKWTSLAWASLALILLFAGSVIMLVLFGAGLSGVLFFSCCSGLFTSSVEVVVLVTLTRVLS